MIRIARRFCAALFALSFAACTSATAGQVDPSNLVQAGKGPFSGRTDGLIFDRDNYGPGLAINGAVDKMFNTTAYVSIEEEFLGDFTIPDEGSADGRQDAWSCTDTNQAAAECAAKADYDNGAVELVIDNGNEVGDATLFWDDEQNIDTDTEPFCIFRTQYQVALAAADTIFWGLASAQADLINDTTVNAGFSVAGADNNLDVMSDDNSTDVNATDTTVDMTAGTFIETMVSLNSIHGTAADPCSPTDVCFFYRTSPGDAWTRVNRGTTFSIGADKAVQPYVQVEKTSGTTTPDILIDYIKCYWQRE